MSTILLVLLIIVLFSYFGNEGFRTFGGGYAGPGLGGILLLILVLLVLHVI